MRKDQKFTRTFTATGCNYENCFLFPFTRFAVSSLKCFTDVSHNVETKYVASVAYREITKNNDKYETPCLRREQLNAMLTAQCTIPWRSSWKICNAIWKICSNNLTNALPTLCPPPSSTLLATSTHISITVDETNFPHYVLPIPS